jgi:hypothetical protein
MNTSIYCQTLDRTTICGESQAICVTRELYVRMTGYSEAITARRTEFTPQRGKRPSSGASEMLARGHTQFASSPKDQG